MYGSGSFFAEPFALRSMPLPKSNPPNMPEAKRSRAKKDRNVGSGETGTSGTLKIS
jgi:hypothetical protein